MGYILTVDIGGTQIRAAVYHRNSLEPLKHKRVPALSAEGGIFDRLVALIESTWPEEGSVDIISAACAGPLDPATGFVFSSPNIPGWVNFPLGEKLIERFGIPVLVGNDANLAAVAEWKYGAGQGYHDLIYLTISTGIGGGVISHDQLLLGHRGLAAELGHITVLPDGPLCSCGQRGHLESLASGPAIAQYVLGKLAGGERSSLKSTPHLSARDVAEAAQQGDPLAKDAFGRAGHFLGQALADYLHIFNPSIIIIGGGVSQSGSLLFEPAEAAMSKYVMDAGFLIGLQIVKAHLGDDAGLLGALALARPKLLE